MTANNITDGKVQALPIKPLKTHAGEAGRRSSITSFDDMLKAQGRTKSTKTSAVKHLDYSADTSKLDRTGKFQNNLICVWDIDRSESENESYGVNRKYKH